MQRLVRRICAALLFAVVLAGGALFGLLMVAALNARWG